MSKGNILVAPLNWGLGHATRCIPIINELLNHGYTPIIASDGKALDLLKKEFPTLQFYKLPSLKIEYTKRSYWNRFNMIFQSLKLYKSIKRERSITKKLVKKYKLKGIISDNRLGLHHSKVPNAIITHQLKVFSGKTTWLSTRLHQHFIKKYDECWVPDSENKPYLSGRLGHVPDTGLKIKYFGLLSRFNISEQPQKYDVLILISGPEPHRSVFERQMLKEFEDFSGTVALVKGKVEEQPTQSEFGKIKVFNFLQTSELETLILQSDIIIARSGYTSLMDLAKLKKKAIFVPTPGQTEQEYLAKRLKKHDVAPYYKQKDFNLNAVRDAKLYEGLSGFFKVGNFDGSYVFSLFERE